MSTHLYVQPASRILHATQLGGTGRYCAARNAPQQPGDERRYQPGLIHQVREHLEQANEKAYQGRDPLHFRDSRVPAEVSKGMEVRN
jgi:hypothetical protein